VFFELVPEAALVLGLDLGARFVRGAISDLRGEIRARQDVEIAGADAEGALDAIGALRSSLVEAIGLPADLIDGAVVGVPGVDPDVGRIYMAANVPGLEGRDFAAELGSRLGLAATLENDINLAALGECWLGVPAGWTTSSASRSGRGSAPASCSTASCTAAVAARRASSTSSPRVSSARSTRARAPCPPSPNARPRRMQTPRSPRLRRPLGVRSGPGRRRPRTCRGRGGGRAYRAPHRPDRRGGRRGAGRPRGGVGANADLLLGPVRTLLERWLPYPPRVEVSSLGEGAVLAGALAVGLRAALDNVFVNRGRSSSRD
jgi:hypothetical protein